VARTRAAVVLVAAGAGSRVGGDTNKVLLPLAGVPVFVWSLRWLQRLSYVDRVLVVHRESDRAAVTRAALEHAPGLDVSFVVGGATRHASEWNALQALAPDVDAGRLDVVAIQDGARPLGGPALFERVIATAAEHGGALPVRAQRGLLRRDGSALPGGELVGVQTPQAFRAGPLLEAYRCAERDGFTGTDTASCIEAYTDLPIHPVPCAATNIKITFPEDVALAERLVTSARR
jgi:2-C-methyl-D-erythritol 4-phosphate cytidylyltransferase